MAFLRIHKLTEKDEIGFPRRARGISARAYRLLLPVLHLGALPEMGRRLRRMDRPVASPLLGLRLRRGVHDAAHRALKERLILHRKTLWGAFLESLAVAILAAMVLELVMGWLINQPDPTTGEYPFLGQLPTARQRVRPGVARERLLHRTGGHDICMGHLPARLRGASRGSPQRRPTSPAPIIVGFAACVTASYLELKLWEKY